MAQTTKGDKLANGFVKVPNWLVDTPRLDDCDKLVIIDLLRHAMDKDVAWPSQITMSLHTGKSRKSVRESLRKLTVSGGISEVQRVGKGQTKYQIHLDVLERIAQEQVASEKSLVARIAHVGGTDCPPKVARIAHKADKAEKTNQKDDSATSEGSSLRGGEIASGEVADMDRSASSPGSPEAVFSQIEVSTQAGGKGDAEALPTLLASPGRSNAEINAALIRPDGFRASDNFDDLSEDLNLNLAMVFGEPLSEDDLDKLAVKHGVRFCHFWAHWFLRKIADEYAKGRPVAKPTGLYRRAVEQGWTVSPKWPEFDAQLHTVAAHKRYIKRKLDRNLKSPHAKFTEADLTILAEDVRKGKRQLTELLPRIQDSVRDKIEHLRGVDDEMDVLFGEIAKPPSVNNDADFDFGAPGLATYKESTDELDEIPF